MVLLLAGLVPCKMVIRLNEMPQNLLNSFNQFYIKDMGQTMSTGHSLR